MQAAQAKNKWIDTKTEEWTLALAKELLPALSGEDQFKIDAVLATRTLDSAAQLALLEAAIASTENVLSQYTSSSSGRSALLLAREAALEVGYVEELQQLLEHNVQVKHTLQARIQLLELQDKTKTWEEIYGTGSSPVASGSGSTLSNHAPKTGHDSQDMEVEEDVEESWQFDEDDADEKPEEKVDIGPSSDPSGNDEPYRLADFLETPLRDLAFQAAAAGEIDVLRTLFNRHARDLNPFRLEILETIPLFTDVVEYTDLLPKYDTRQDLEIDQQGRPWRLEDPEWQSEPKVKKLLGLEVPEWTASSARELAEWYKARVEEMDEATGQIDNALSLVQYGAAQGLPGLDALGEELSLLSRLVYDRRSATSDFADQQAWSLSKWQQATESDIVDAYLSQSKPSTIAQDIRAQVLPYLYVLESQREREGRPDFNLHDTMLFDWMLRAASTDKPGNLHTIAAIFQASKPTLPTPQRIVRSNQDLARLALACCYGHPGSSSSSIQAMLQIFDCLPSFEDADAPVDPSQTLSAIVSSNESSKSPSTSLTPSQLFMKMDQWPVNALSRALDTLDLHLEAAEIFERWKTPVTLQFFITLSADEKAQRLWADRLAKTSPAAVSQSARQGRIGGDFEDEDEWISLLDDLCKLGGKGTYSEGDPRPAFSALSQQEITKIFFGGLLSSASKRFILES